MLLTNEFVLQTTVPSINPYDPSAKSQPKPVEMGALFVSAMFIIVVFVALVECKPSPYADPLTG